MKQNRLGEYVKIVTGKLNANVSDKNGIYPFFTCSINNLMINSYAYDCECVLVAGNGDLNVKYYEGKFNAYQRTYIVESVDKKALDVKFLFYFMSKYVEVLRRGSIGGVIKYIKLGDLTDALIPLPPLQTQKKIVEALDKAQSLIDSRKEQIKLLDDLIQSKFFDMFNNGNRDKYKIFSLDKLCENIYDCPHSTPKYSTLSTGYKCLKTSNLKNGYIVWDYMPYVNKEVYDERTKRYKPQIGDVVYSREGAILGIAAIVNKKDQFCLGQRLMIFSLDKSKVTSEFFWMIMNSNFVSRQVELNIGGAAAPRINIKDIKNFQVYLPPIDLQTQFAEIVQKIVSQKQLMEKSLEEMENNYNGLMQRAFKGELFS